MIGHEERWEEIKESARNLLGGSNYGGYFQDLDIELRMSIELGFINQYYQNGTCHGLHGVTFHPPLLLLLKHPYTPSRPHYNGALRELHYGKPVHMRRWGNEPKRSG